jgi:hypothetical protein
MIRSKFIKNLIGEELPDPEIKGFKAGKYNFVFGRPDYIANPTWHRMQNLKFLYTVIDKKIDPRVVINGYIIGVNKKYIYFKWINSIHSYMKELSKIGIHYNDLVNKDFPNHNQAVERLIFEIEHIVKIFDKLQQEAQELYKKSPTKQTIISKLSPEELDKELSEIGINLDRVKNIMQGMGYKYYYYIESEI